MHSFFSLIDLSLLGATLRIGTTLLLGSLGYSICSRAGVIDMGIEGKLLLGAFIAAYVTYLTGNPTVGVLVAMLLTALYNVVVALMLVKLRAQQVIVGIGSNFLLLGLTTVLLNVLWLQPSTSPPVERLAKGITGPMSKLPLIGPIFKMQTPIMPIVFVLIVIAYIVFFKTRIGLRLRAVGENPVAADTLGIPVNRYQITAMLICGLLCGLAGADLTVGQLGYFGKEMISGRGFIALSCAVVGRFHPLGIVATSLAFAFVDALQIRLQGTFNVPGQFFQIIPYLTPIIVLGFFSGFKTPGGLGKPLNRGER